MSVIEVQGVEGLKELVGRKVGPGEWREVTQEMVACVGDSVGRALPE